MMSNLNKIVKLNQINSDIISFIPILIFIAFIAFRDSKYPQRAIDGGLLISGEINYEKNSIMFESLTNSFTLLHYFSALLIKINLTLLQISFVLQLLNYLLISLGVFLINKKINTHILFNYLSIFIILNAIPFFLLKLTFNYPLFLNSVNTYGQFGLGLSLLILGLFLFNKYNFLKLLFPIFFSIHAAWTLTSYFVIFLCFILFYKKLNIKNIYNVNYLLLGTFLVSPAWIHYFITSIKVKNEFSKDLLKNLYRTYINNWDYHRSFNIEFTNFYIHLFFAFVIFLFIFRIKNLNIFIKIFVTIIMLNSFLGLSLTFLDDVVLKREFLILNSFMPGKIINLSILLYIILFFNLLTNLNYSIIKKLNSLKTILFPGLSLSITLLILTNSQFFDLYNLRLDKSIKFNQDLDSNLCKILKNTDSKIVTIGNASQFVTLNCRNPILIDTTQIDFIPYSRQSLPNLKEIINNVYGLDFESRKETSNRLAIPSIPSGGVDELLVQAVWINRNENTWNFLACKYNFDYLLVPNNFNLRILPKIIGKEFTLYTFKDACVLKKNNFVGDFFFNLPAEIGGDSLPFYWITDKSPILYIKSLSESDATALIDMKFFPNPCKNMYLLNVKSNKENKSLEVGQYPTELKIQQSVSFGKFTEISLNLNSDLVKCEIEGELRNLLTLIKDINIT